MILRTAFFISLTVANLASVASRCSTIAEIACSTDGFGTLCSAVQATGLGKTLSTGTFTVFAPTDEAFANLPAGILSALLIDIPALTDILLFHTVAGKELYSSDLQCQETIKMANGDKSRTVCRGKKVFQKGSGNPRSTMPEITSTDIEACNGVVHVVNQVMLPPSIDGGDSEPKDDDDGGYSEPKDDDDGDYSEPKDDDDGGYSEPKDDDDGGYSEPKDDDDGGDSEPKDYDEGCSTILDIACTTPGFTTLCTAVVAADLDGPLGHDTFTVFAPLDSAFDNLPPKTVESLLNDIPALTDILLFHAVAGKEVFSSDLHCTETIKMANGEESRTVCRGKSIFQKGSGNSDKAPPEIATADIKACNGVVHVVTEVMLP